MGQNIHRASPLPDNKRILFWLNLGCFFLMLASSALIVFAFWPEEPKAEVVTITRQTGFRKEPIQPIPLKVKLNLEMVALGRNLFHDVRLSKDNSVSCASCHILDKGGVDRKRFSVGVNHIRGTLNTPTVFNAFWNFRQFWDGRAANLHDQIDGPLTAPNEMATSWDEVVRKLIHDPQYARWFGQVFPAGINPETIRAALVEFERSLFTPNARFDQYLRGNDAALTPTEKEGYKLFKEFGCIACHQGTNVGGNMYQTFGVVGDYFKKRGKITKADYGRYNVTKREEDRYKFKVPSLRNVELTPPYLHDGNAKTLDDAVRIMGRYQIGRIIPRAQRKKIVAFLKTLTGRTPR